MTEKDIRDALISQVTERQHEIGKQMAVDRSMPLLASTLTMQQLKTLVILGRSESVTGHELAKHLGVKLGTVTGIVDRLVSQDLVDRREDPQDRRVRRISLTHQGLDLVNTMLDTGASHMRSLLEALDTETLRQLDEIMAKLLEAAMSNRDNADSDSM